MLTEEEKKNRKSILGKKWREKNPCKVRALSDKWKPLIPKEKTRAYVNKCKALRREFILKYKSDRGCSRCSEKDPVCLDFHHISEKEFSIASLKSSSVEKLNKEISKCIILCANCHRKEHSNGKAYGH